MALSGSLKRSGRVADALPVNDRVLALERKHLGPKHVLVGRTLADQGDLLRRLGRNQEAEQSLVAAAEVLEPLQNQELGLLLVFRGRLEMERGRFAAAETAFARAEQVYRATLGDAALDTWGARADRGAALHRLGRRDEAERIQTEAVAAVARLAGEGSAAHREVAEKLAETLGGDGAGVGTGLPEK
jgi:serine/threonine-protein kinase